LSKGKRVTNNTMEELDHHQCIPMDTRDDGDECEQQDIRLSGTWKRLKRHSSDITPQLRDWWSSSSDATPVSRVAFVSCTFRGRVSDASPNTKIPIDLDRIEQNVSFDDTPLLVLYSLSMSDGCVYVMGCIVADQLRRLVHASLQEEERAYIRFSDLTRSKDVNITRYIRNQGVPNASDYWFIMPDLQRNALAGDFTMDQVAYRMDLMLTFWKHRNNPEFVNGDSQEMLLTLHRNTYFALNTEQGRQFDVDTFWGLVLACSHDTRLWESWAYWERTLLEFRISCYFCKERHFSAFLLNNNLTQDLQVVQGDAIDEREKQLYRARHPKGPLPRLWVSVPSDTVGSLVCSSPHYDVEKGRVIITYKEFPVWAWHQMEKNVRDFMKKVNFRYIHPNINEPALVRRDTYDAESNVYTMVESLLHKAQRELGIAQARERETRIQQRAEAFFNGDLEAAETMDLGGRESLINIAKTKMPPCQARHVWMAFVNGQHPKNMDRVSFVSYLLEAGYTVQEVDSVMFLMYEADTQFVNQKYSGRWDLSGYNREYGGQVKRLHCSVVTEKRTSAYGCMHLMQAGSEGKTYGCPFTKGYAPIKDSQQQQQQQQLRYRPSGPSTGAMPEIVSILQWTGCSDGDIEDIMKPNEFPQTKCCRYYQHLNPGKTLTVKHPNQYMKFSSGSGGNGMHTSSSPPPPLAVTPLPQAVPPPAPQQNDDDGNAVVIHRDKRLKKLSMN